MTACNFTRLGQNLDALYSASDAQELICNPSCKELAHVSSFHGTIWKGLSALTRRFSSIDKQNSTLSSVQQEFQKALHVMDSVDKEYRLHLIQNKTTKELRSKILLIAERCTTLFTLSHPSTITERIERLNRFFAEGICSSKDEQILQSLSIDHALCTVELRVGRAYPLNIFSKIIERLPLDAEDERVLGEWIAKLQRPSSYITSALLHQALQGCVEVITKSGIDNDDTLNKLSALEWQILSRKAFVLQEKDPEHIEWVKTALKDTFGKQIFHLENEHLSFFEEKNESGKMIVCGKNSAHIGIWRSACTHFAWSVQPAHCFFQDPLGRYCIIEKLDHSLEEVDWNVQNDRRLLDELSHLLQFWARHAQIPKQISLQDIFVKKDGDGLILKVISPILFTDITEPDFNRLESFARLFSKENREVFSYLMKKSHLSEHPVAKAYLEIAFKMLIMRENTTIAQELALYGISDAAVLERAKEYVAALKDAHGELFERLRVHLKKGQAEKPLFDAIAKGLMQLQKDSGFCSVIHPDLASLVDTLQSTIINSHKGFFR